MGPTMRRATGCALSRSSLLGYVRGPEEMGALSLVFFTLHYRMYYISGSYGQSFLASGDLKTRLMLRARSIDWSISRYYKIYTRARENGLDGRNGTDRNGMKKITCLSIVKRNGTETGSFFDSYCTIIILSDTCTCF